MAANISTNSEHVGIDAQLDIAQIIETEPIRKIVEQYPEVLTVLAQYDMDLCCGGGHTIRQAALLHDVDAALLRDQVRAVILWTRG